MKIRLIADENISWRLKKLIAHWEILPVNEINIAQKLTDATIWQYAKQNQYVILTFDEDFAEFQALYLYPPKIIWLRTGNTSTNYIANRLLELESEIIGFILNDELGIYEIYLKK